MPVSQDQSLRIAKKRKRSDVRKTAKEPALYGYIIEPGKLKTVRWDKWPAGVKVMLVRTAGDPKFVMPKTLRKPFKRIRFERIEAWEVDSPAPAIKDEAFQPGARARALLQGVEIIEQDLKASGGAFGLDDVCKLMHGVTRQAINKQVNEGRLLAVPGPSNRNVYPVVQFGADGALVEGLKEVREALATKSPWMVLNFLVNADPRLDNRKPIELLKKGRVDVVLEAARRIGTQGA